MQIRTVRGACDLIPGSCSSGMKGGGAESSTATTRSGSSAPRPLCSPSTGKSDIRPHLIRTMVRRLRRQSAIRSCSSGFRSTTRPTGTCLSMPLTAPGTYSNACSSSWKRKRATRLVAALVLFFIHLFISMPADAALPPGQYSCNPNMGEWGSEDPDFPFLANSLAECLDKLRARYDSKNMNPCLVYASTTALGPPRPVATLWMAQDFFIIYGDNPLVSPGRHSTGST